MRSVIRFVRSVRSATFMFAVLSLVSTASAVDNRDPGPNAKNPTPESWVNDLSPIGVADWNSMEWPALLRWSVGLPLVIMGNAMVWTGVAQIGLAATSGEATGLRTKGLYRYSRNPQYVADVLILIGWSVLTASGLALPLVVLGILVLVVAPFAEEPWLVEKYGRQYTTYRSNVPRYI